MRGHIGRNHNFGVISHPGSENAIHERIARARFLLVDHRLKPQAIGQFTGVFARQATGPPIDSRDRLGITPIRGGGAPDLAFAAEAPAAGRGARGVKLRLAVGAPGGGFDVDATGAAPAATGPPHAAIDRHKIVESRFAGKG